jgi:hypothetical protein
MHIRSILSMNVEKDASKHKNRSRQKIITFFRPRRHHFPKARAYHLAARQNYAAVEPLN